MIHRTLVALFTALLVTFPALTASAEGDDPVGTEASNDDTPKPIVDAGSDEIAENDDAAEEPRGAPVVGGFGFFSPGMFVAPIGGLPDELANDEWLGDGADQALVATTIGGGGRAFVHNFLLGGKGWGFFYPEVDGERGSSAVFGGGGGFDVGYAVLNENPWLVYPFIGIQGIGVQVELTNTTDQAITFDDGDIVVRADQIQPDAKRTYTAGILLGEIGIGGQWLLHDGHGGFKLGAEIGGLFTLASSKWEEVDSGEELEDIDAASLNGAYLKVTIGGGGFALADLE